MAWFHGAAHRLPTLGGRGVEFAKAFAADVWADRWEAVFREVTAVAGPSS
jgi:hypothetical protein